MRAGTALLQILAGLCLGGAGVHLARGQTGDGAPPPEPPGNPAAAAAQTLKDDEPPPFVGPGYDADAALPSKAVAVASYQLSARLDDAAHIVTGKGVIEWKNAASRPASELFLHLYLNAFKNNRTVFLRSPFGGNRSGRGAQHWGYIDVERLVVREMGGASVFPDHPSTPDDVDDQTDVRVPLPRAVEPGEKITLDVEWKSQLPEIVERTGYVRDFHMVAQWFPKIARREPDGTWAHFPFHAESEFYSDFGSYDVTLDVPAAVVVGATGALAEERAEGARHVYRYVADDVHDFAWTAWKGFQVREEVVDGVRVRLLHPRGNDRNAEATLRAVRHGLAFYGERLGRYPYRTLTVVHPPEFAPAAGGMEYPTLITTGFPWYTSYLSPFVERVTLHELGHQWFYGLVATDEHSWPFLDEGLTTYVESSAMRALFGVGNGLTLGGLAVDGDAYLRAMASEAGHDDLIARPAAAFASFQAIGALVYSRTGIVLETMARVYGREALERALGRYARRYRFEHPNPKHLIAVVREVLGGEAAAFLHTALFEGGWVDFVPKDLRTTQARAPEGVFDRGAARETVPRPAAQDVKWAGRVVVYRHGTLRLPVDVDLHFADGSHERRHWDGTGRFQSFHCESKSPLVSAVVDPDSRVLLDENLRNDSTGKSGASLARTLERAVYASELLLGAAGP